MKLIYIFALITLNLISSCSKSIETDPENNDQETVDADYNLLFVGNSLTFYNNLPDLVEKESVDYGVKISTEMLAYPNYAIIDHWNDGKVQQLIKSKKFDYVIIQQGPSSQQEGRNMLLNDGAKYANLCSENDAELVYFMVWPSVRYFHTFNGVIKNYTDGAELNKAILCPVGSVWKDYIDTTNDYSYYGQDQFHPSLEGSKVAARVIVETLFEH